MDKTWETAGGAGRELWELVNISVKFESYVAIDVFPQNKINPWFKNKQNS